jgi:APA family basic amino acid/polyamine antiporter
LVEGFFFSLSMEKNQQLKKEIGLLDASMIVIGSMIGSGIFIVSADVTRNLGSPGYLLLTWIITGIITLICPIVWRTRRYDAQRRRTIRISS